MGPERHINVSMCGFCSVRKVYHKIYVNAMLWKNIHAPVFTFCDITSKQF